MIFEQVTSLAFFWFFIGSMCAAKAISAPVTSPEILRFEFHEAWFATFFITLFWPLYVVYRFFNK